MIAQGCRILSQVCVAVGLALLWGCAGTGEMVSVNLQSQQLMAQGGQPEPVKIVIEPFEDLRADKSKIGQRSHLGGGVTYFNVPGGSPGVTIAEAWRKRCGSAPGIVAAGMRESCSRAWRSPGPTS
ncbi:MAG: hypothetical protein UZ03_NOB001000342 [Nitrospira sp. OLB3]|nr:MAG: hypothetical protein UZ03_NOB001000342 [Nitrospira sp. OLB3]